MQLRHVTASVVSLAALVSAVPAFAHPHKATNAHDGDGQVLANGQNHYAFAGDLTCDWFADASGGPAGPAWYGLEVAHHGPDGADPGRDDGCFLRTAGDRNPGIG